LYYGTAGRYQLVEDWFALLAYCDAGDVNRKTFKANLDSLAKDWARSTIEIQGYCSEQISQRLKPGEPDG
jgi:hypothetical protein